MLLTPFTPTRARTLLPGEYCFAAIAGYRIGVADIIETLPRSAAPTDRTRLAFVRRRNRRWR
jgi:hypothetical protein